VAEASAPDGPLVVVGDRHGRAFPDAM